MQPSQGQDLQEGVYRTPMNLLVPSNRRWPIGFDLAANASNEAMMRVHGLPFAEHHYNEEQDALKQSWLPEALNLRPGEFAWCNPPYGNLGRWTKKAAEEAAKGARFLMLVPSATGADWLVNEVLHLRLVFLVGRPIFEFINSQDHKNPEKRGKPNTDPYGKDLLLIVADGTLGGAREWWRWKDA